MNNISGDNEVYSGLGLVQQQQDKSHNQLDLDDFLDLMITELTHQDPFKPMDNTELASQMSQFATVSGIGDLNQEVSSLASSLTSDQGLRAANLVGHEVMVPTNAGYLNSGGSVSGAVKLDSSVSNMVLRVTNASGALVREIELGTGSEGEVAFNWDGFTDSGNAAPPGRYRFSVEGEVDGEPFTPPMLMSAKVNSVSLGAPGQGVALNLEGLGAIALQDVAEIH
jgi:flagellar basal-body rod modification protein FlgD